MKRMWSKNELRDIIKLTDFQSVDFKAKTLEQLEANWKSANLVFPAPTGFEITNIYNRCEVIGNVMHIVVSIKLVNNSGSTKTLGGTDVGVVIPEEYAEKIIDVDGKSVAAADATNYCFIAGEPMILEKNSNTYNGTFYGGRIFATNRNEARKMSIFASPSETISMDDGDYIYLSGRIALTLI